MARDGISQETTLWMIYMIFAGLMVFFASVNIAEAQASELRYDSEVYIIQTQGFNATSVSTYTQNSTSTEGDITANEVSAGWLKNFYSLLIFNISISTEQSFIMSYWWLLRIFFIWLPFLMFLKSIYYSLPFV